jgi:tRNA-specific 2-thiouridylase
LTDVHWINDAPKEGKTYRVRTRYRAPLVDCTLHVEGGIAGVKLSDKVRAITPGQSAVIYDDNRVVGGGIVI